MINNKPITIKTLKKKCNKWQDVLDLSNWAITIKYGTSKEVGKESVGCVDFCDHETRKANIIILDKYYECERYGTFYNVDTIILHELIHILIWEKSDLPSKITRRKDFSTLEEFVCDKFADIIFRIKNKKNAKLPKI